MNDDKRIYVHPDGLNDITKPGGTIDNPYSIKILSNGGDYTGYEIILLDGIHKLAGPINAYSTDPKDVVEIRAANRWRACIKTYDENGKYFFQMTGKNVHLKDVVLEDATVADRHISEQSPEMDIAGYPSFEAENQRIVGCLIGNLKMGIGFWSNVRETLFAISDFGTTQAVAKKAQGAMPFTGRRAARTALLLSTMLFLVV